MQLLPIPHPYVGQGANFDLASSAASSSSFVFLTINFSGWGSSRLLTNFWDLDPSSFRVSSFGVAATVCRGDFCSWAHGLFNTNWTPPYGQLE